MRRANFSAANFPRSITGPKVTNWVAEYFSSPQKDQSAPRIQGMQGGKVIHGRHDIHLEGEQLSTDCSSALASHTMYNFGWLVIFQYSAFLSTRVGDGCGPWSSVPQVARTFTPPMSCGSRDQNNANTIGALTIYRHPEPVVKSHARIKRLKQEEWSLSLFTTQTR